MRQVRPPLFSAALLAIMLMACGTETVHAPTPEAAASVSPTSAPLWRSAGTPPSAPVGSEWIAVDTFDGKSLLAAIGRPSTFGPWPVVIVLHGDGGLRQMHLDLAENFRAAGFLTVTPCWQGYTESDARASGVPIGIGCAIDAPQRNTAEAVVKDLSAIADASRTLFGARNRVALVGHSAGAMAGVLTGSMGGRIDAVVAISAGYGRGQIIARWGTSLPDQVDGLAVPLLMVHGTNDQQSTGTKVDVARAYEKLARDRGRRIDALYLDGAPHQLPYLSEWWTTSVQGRITGFLASAFGQLP